jgi:hypothetical protein
MPGTVMHAIENKLISEEMWDEICKVQWKKNGFDLSLKGRRISGRCAVNLKVSSKAKHGGSHL